MKPVLRYLRIGFSITCLIACVLLIVLWVRSYWGHFDIRFPRSDHWLCSLRGWTQLLCDSDRDPLTGMARPEFIIPFWLPTVLAVASSAAPWLPWWSKRFSLRTLLIVMTLVALVLGLIVWQSHG
jgi:hypothetical protein